MIFRQKGVGRVTPCGQMGLFSKALAVQRAGYCAQFLIFAPKYRPLSTLSLHARHMIFPVHKHHRMLDFCHLIERHAQQRKDHDQVAGPEITGGGPFRVIASISTVFERASNAVPLPEQEKPVALFAGTQH